jgi:hypothetical protein
MKICVDQAAHGLVEELVDAILVGEACALDSDRCSGSLEEQDKVDLVLDEPVQECRAHIFVIVLEEQSPRITFCEAVGIVAHAGEHGRDIFEDLLLHEKWC